MEAAEPEENTTLCFVYTRSRECPAKKKTSIIILDGKGRVGGGSRRAGGRDERTPPVVNNSGPATSVTPPPPSGANSTSAGSSPRVSTAAPWVARSARRQAAGAVKNSNVVNSSAERHDTIFRRVRSILNKLTPDKFDKLSLELLNVGINSEIVLRGIILLIFEKALDEAKYSSLYATLCQRLCEDAPSFEPPSSNISTFKKLLLNKCQDEFENRSRATEAFEKEIPLTPDEEEQLLIARRKMLGNIKFIGELGKLDMLHETILHQCIKQLLAKKRNITMADQAEDLECLAQIMRTIGNRLDHDKARLWMDQYFERIKVLMAHPELPARIRFLLQDVVELRQQNWKPRRALTDVAPRTIHQVHMEAAKEFKGPPNQNPALNMMGMPGSGVMMMGTGGIDLFPPQPRTMNGSAGRTGPMSDMFGPMSPPFLGGGGTGIGTGPGTIPMDSFTPSFFNSGNNRGAPRNQQPNKGYYGGRRSDEGRSSPRSDHRQSSSPQPNQENRSSSPRYTHNDRNRGNQPSPPSQRSGRYGRNEQKGEGRDYSPGQDGGQRGSNYDRGNRGSGNPQNAFQNKPHFQQRNRDANNQSSQQQQSQQQAGRELPPRFQRKLQQQQPDGQQKLSPGFTQPFPDADDKQTQLFHNGRGSPASGGGAKQEGVPLGADTTRDEISLRPTRNFAPLLRPNTPSFLPRSAQQQPQQPMMQLRPRMMGPAGMGSVDATTTSEPQVPIMAPAQPQITIKPGIEKEKKKEHKDNKSKGPPVEELKKSMESILKTLLEGGNIEDAMRDIKALKMPRGVLPQIVSGMLLMPLSSGTDDNRDTVSGLVSKLYADGFINSDVFLQGFELVLKELPNLESEVTLIKSYVGRYGGWGVSHGVITLSQLARLMEDGQHYPLFLLCLQQLHKIRDKDWLLSAYQESKLDLITMLPECDRSKERLLEILEDRGLSFLLPLMRLQADLSRQMASDPAPNSLYKWVKENVNTSLHSTVGFINILATSIFKHVAMETTLPSDADITVTPDKVLVEKEKELLGRYKAVIQVFVRESTELQLITLYALQVLCHINKFPKGMMLRMFMNLYDLEVIYEETFIKWKEDINDEYPGKGKALFQVNQWLTWLEQAEEEDSEEDD